MPATWLATRLRRAKSDLRHGFSPTRLREHGSKLWLGVAKATLALTIFLALSCIDSFALLSPDPTTLSSGFLVIVGAYPGGSTGKCFQAITLGGFGLALGVLVYTILGFLAHAPTAQGFVFAAWVYLAALVRFGGPKYISFYLYGVLFSFNGIYRTITTGEFRRELLLADFIAYAWGIAIALGVNVLVFPTTAEEQLRGLLVTSLQHVATLAHLTCKTFARELDAEESEVRQVLAKSLRSDYLALDAQLDEMKYELAVSKYSLRHFREMIGAVQALQQALITSSSATDLIDSLDPNGISSRRLLSRAETARTFADFRHGIDLVIAEIIDVLVGPVAVEKSLEAGTHDPEKQATERTDEDGAAQAPAPFASDADEQEGNGRLGAALHTTPTPVATQEKMVTVAAKLKREVQQAEQRHRRIREDFVRERSESRRRGGSSPSTSRPATPSLRPVVSPRTSTSETARGRATTRESDDTVVPGEDADGQVPAVATTKPELAGPAHEDVVQIFRKAWDAFARSQQDALVSLIKDGSLQVDDVLLIEAGMPSIKEMYADRLPKAWTSSLVAQTQLARLRSRAESVSAPSVASESPSEETACSEALTRSYSLLFGLGQLTEGLYLLHDLATREQPKKLRLYLAHTLADKVHRFFRPKDTLNLQQALATLHGQPYTEPRKPFVHYIVRAERWAWSQRSTYAAKVAMAATVYAVFALAPVLQEQVFLKIGQVSALITVIVAVAPTLGGTLSTWLFQISGTGAGALLGFITLEVFKDTGGYRYNPYGLTAIGAIWFAWSSYKFLLHPAKYTQSLLYVVGYGGIVVQEYMHNDLPGVESQYDSPPLRFGYTIASLAISMGISAVFQLFFFRQPARHRLRLQLADTMFRLSAYNSLLQAFVNLVAPADEAPTPKPEALAKVHRELVKREIRIQADILALAPTFQFAKIEPKFQAPFKADSLLRIMRSQQIILDRLREARTAVGLHGFNATIHHDFANVLFPYRLHSQRLSRTLFYLSATSLMCKTQLARDVPSSKPTWSSFEHDALVLSRRLSNLPRGEEELKRPGFLRYWFYLVSLGSVSNELEEMEKYLGDLFGDPDESNPYIS
ncbi:hypothetical protein JCM8115_003668 [Rhodotorula mucilaginosa]|uniref:Putative ER transporter 6TM N-terminal domain-containing protein n=1 Tax=Rhodotorula mucilaginosa TaxID=5537 RepID=A0A9P7B6Y9_RHOMI|nr:hypothetical protein C6P46_003837 [Rhodotorula mucilaginosa]